jgi:hypothetical protein
MSVSSFIFAYLKQKLPTINWNIGSTVRELIAQPLVTATDAATKALTDQANAVSVQSYIDNPEAYETQINETFELLGLNENTSINSRGTVTIFTTSKSPSAVYKNTLMYYDDQIISVSLDTYPSLQPDGSAGSTQLRELSINSYAFDVPVEASSMNTYITKDTKLSWDEAPDDVYDIIVTSPVSGGRTQMSLLDKAMKIKDYVAPAVLSLNDGVAKNLRESMPDIISDAKYAADITDASKAMLYIKTLKAPGNYWVDVQGIKQDNGLYKVQTTVLGFIALISAYKDTKKVNIHQLQVTNNDILCSIEYNGQAVENFSLNVYGMEDAFKVQEFISGYTAGSPFKIEVKAPAVFDLSVEFKYTGQELNAQSIKDICSQVQSYPLGEVLNDYKLNGLLNSYGASLVGTATYMVSDYNGSCYKQQYAPTMHHIKSNNYAVYTGLDRIKALYV